MFKKSKKGAEQSAPFLKCFIKIKLLYASSGKNCLISITAVSGASEP